MSDCIFHLIEQHIQIFITFPNVDQNAPCHEVARKILFTKSELFMAIILISL